MRRMLVVALILITTVVGAYKWNFPTASYRYRLTIAVESGGQVHSGSSVIQVWYRFNPPWFAALAGGSQFDVRVTGQAVLVDLGSNGAVIAALHSGTGSGHLGVNADALAGRAFLSFPANASGFPVTLKNVQLVSQKQGPVNLASNNLPPFIWFPSITNANNAQLVSPRDFEGVIGNKVQLTRAQLTITNDPVVLDLNKHVPWLANLATTNGAVTVKVNGDLNFHRVLVGYNAFMNEGSAR